MAVRAAARPAQRCASPDCLLERPGHLFGAMVEEEFEEPTDVRGPRVGPRVDEFGKERLGGGADLEEPLPLVVQLRPTARDRRQRAGGVLRQRADAVVRMPRMADVVAVGHDPHPVPIQEQGGREPDGLRRHRVADPLEHHPPRGPHAHRESQSVLRGREGQRPQSAPLLGDAR